MARGELLITMRSVRELDFRIVAWCGPCNRGRGVSLEGYDESETTLIEFCGRLRCGSCKATPMLITISHQCRGGGRALPVLKIETGRN